MHYRKVRLTLPMLFSVAAIAIASTAFAQVSGSFRVSFGTSPRWETVPGTQVYVVRDVDRPNYDIFRFGGSYYVYSNDRWYTSRRMNGDFVYITDDRVPYELSLVPRERWRSYPSRWSYRDRHYDDGATFRVSFNSRPRWEYVRGTRVRMIPYYDRPGYDMFAYAGRYYVYNDGQWYTSRNWRGNFRLIDRRAVPRELRRIPRQHWRNYAWDDDYDRDRYRDGYRDGYRR